MNIDLTGRSCLICGASRGIGKASAIELAASGGSVTIVARGESELKDVLLELDSSKGQRHSYLCADFSNPALLKEQFIRSYGGEPNFHVLVNNTGGPPAGAALAATPEEFLAAFSSHLLCNQILTQLIVPGMKKAKFGRIINIISTSVKQPIAGLGVSNTVRGAVANWAKTLANELGPFGITVNNVLPGPTRTQRMEALIQNKASKEGKSAASIEAQMIEEVPARRFAEPAEIASAVAFLASPAAGYINGINLPVDGGRTACL